MSWPAELRALLAEVFGKEEEPADETPKAKPTPADRRVALQKIRDHLGKVGGALAAGATALLVGLGWTQLHNVFPAPAGDRILVPVIAFASAAAALLGIGWLTRTIFAAQRRIPMVSDADRLGELGSLSKEEREIRDKVFASVAEEHQVASLRELELQARECDRKAEEPTTPASEKARLQEKAARLDAAVDQAVVGAATLILEQRSGNVFRGGQPIAAFVLASLGIIVAFGVADYSKGQRDLIALRKSCAEAASAGVKDACKSIVEVETGSGESKGPTTGRTIAVGVQTRGSSCGVTVRVDDKTTRAAKSGMAKVSINDRSRLCGVRIDGGGLSLYSRARHTGTATSEASLKPISYSIVMLRVPRGSTPTPREIRVDPLVVGP